MIETQEIPKMTVIHANDPFSMPDKPKRVFTRWQKITNAIVDTISSLFVKIWGLFLDKELKYVLIAIATLVFTTGLVYNIIWAIVYWNISIVLFMLYITWRIWSTIKKKDKQKTHQKKY